MAKWLDKILGIDKLQKQQTERIEMLSNGTASFTPFNSNAYENDIYRSAVDAIARNAAKLRGKHIIYSKDSNQRTDGDHNLNRVLNTRPNPYMSAYDLIYKLVTHYYLHNNAFAYLEKDNRGNLIGIYPLSANQIEYVTDQTNEMYMKFLFNSGQSVTLHMSEVLVLRRHFNSNDLLGDSNTAIMAALELAHTQNEGLSESIKSSATIRGILKYNKILAPEELRKAKEEFTRDYLNMSNNGGIAALDTKTDYIPLQLSEMNIDNAQIEAVKRKVYDYLGISEVIINSTYTEDQWSAFYESVIEPLAIQLSLELTDKVFTQREQAFGNTIVFEASRLQFASNESKTNIIKELVPYGILTINQALEILNMPPVEDGHKRLQTLNVVNADLADEYQKGDKSDEGNTTHRDTSPAE